MTSPRGRAGSSPLRAVGVEGKSPRFKWILVAVLTAVALLLLMGVYRLWRGPSVPTYKIQSQPLVQTVVSTGWVTSFSQAKVGSEIVGVVLERRVHEGDAVKAGDVLLVLRSDEWLARLQGAEAALKQLKQSTRPQAQLAADRARDHYKQVARETKRQHELFDRKLIAQEVLEQAQDAENVARTAFQTATLTARALAPGNSEETLLHTQLEEAKAMLAKTVIKAQAPGVVLTRDVEPGDLVQPGRVLLVIAQSSMTEILLPVDEKNLAVLAVGQTAQCVADAFPNQPFTAHVTYIAPSVDIQSGTVEVHLQAPNLPTSVKEGMTLSVNVRTGSRDQTLAIPNDALAIFPNGQINVLRIKNGKIRRTPVKLGLRGLIMTEVVSGLTHGDRILANGKSTLPDGKRVHPIDQELPESAPNDSGPREFPASF